MSCLTLLKTCPQRGDLLAWGVRSLHDEGLAGDDLVLETAGRCEKLLKESDGVIPEGTAAANGAGKTARPECAEDAGPTAGGGAHSSIITQHNNSRPTYRIT